MPGVAGVVGVRGGVQKLLAERGVALAPCDRAGGARRRDGRALAVEMSVFGNGRAGPGLFEPQGRAAVSLCHAVGP